MRTLTLLSRCGVLPLFTQRLTTSTWLIVALVALRLGIGWQFFKEGASKFQDDKPQALGILTNAKGPLAPMFQNMIWDKDGYARLDLAGTLTIWEQAPHRAARHYGYDNEKRDKAVALSKLYEAQLRQFHGDNRGEINEYFAELERLRTNESDPSMMQVASLSGQVVKRRGEQKGKAAGWLATIDAMWERYERDLHAIAGDGGAGRATYRMPRPGRRFMDSEWIDGAVRWFDLLIGLFLLAGLFTRFASIAGVLFLGSIVATQPPWVADAAPTYYQVNLMLGLLVLAAAGAGRFAGLDLFVGRLCQQCCPPKSASKQASARGSK